MQASRDLIIGIDLGTTNSCTAYVDHGHPKVIKSTKGYAIIPSVVGIDKKGSIVVGHVAVDQMVTNPTETIHGAKRLLGRPFDSLIVQQMKELVTYPIVEGASHEAAVILGGRQYDLIQISALILKEIRTFAEGQLEREIRRAVITVPAYYTDKQRLAVKRAGSLAGLQVERIVNEPTAAAIAYGFNKGLNQNILVYDFGGGTFDVSVMRLRQNEFRVLATGGDTFLGGIDIDNRLTSYVLDKFKAAAGKDLRTEKVALQRVRRAAEQAKKDLSDQVEVELMLPYITEVNQEPVDLKLKIRRSQLDDLCRDLVKRTLTICDEVLTSVQLKPSDIDEILLVGGQTRMPLIQEYIQKHFGKEPRKGVHPEEVVALGASLLAQHLESSSKMLLRDVLSIPIGIALPDGTFKPILTKHSPIPQSKSFKMTQANHDVFAVDLFQGEHPKAKDNVHLGTCIFPKAQRPSKGRDIMITFELSAECLLRLKMKDPTTGEEVLSEWATQQSQEKPLGPKNSISWWQKLKSVFMKNRS